MCGTFGEALAVAIIGKGDKGLNSAAEASGSGKLLLKVPRLQRLATHSPKSLIPL